MATEQEKANYRLDVCVLSELTDARRPAAEIADKLGAPIREVIESLKRLEASGDALNTGFGWVTLAPDMGGN